MTERKLLALALSTTLCLAVTTGMATHGLFTDSESLGVEFSGNVAGNAPASSPTESPGDTGSDTGNPSGSGNAPAGPSERAGNVPDRPASDGVGNTPSGAGNAPSSSDGAVIGGSAAMDLRVAPRTS